VASIGACAVLIAALSGGAEGTAELSRVAQRVLADLRAAGGDRDGWHVGVGPPVSDLVAVVVSYAAALDAIRIAAVVPQFGQLAAWDELGAWRLLSRIPRDDGLHSAIHPALARLARLRDGEVLLHTLEVYLDHGGNAHVTAETLCVHRTSVYARLRRIATVAGVDLDSGDDRLALHMSLRLQRLFDREHSYANGRRASAFAT
jgi:sugar diacid utilization regulator